MATRAALVSTTDGMTSMLQDLNAMQDEDSRRRAEESERLHEVRSVLAGLHAATGSLRKYEDSIDPDVRRRLEDAVGAELKRLNHLIDPRIPEVTIDLVLEAVVMSVVVAEREQGLVITTDLAEVSVQGNAAEIATLVSDLLVNARVHAPGSQVRLTARVDGEVVTLSVRDWGPGLSAFEAERVFERSFRGARPIAAGVPGSGLGLHNARKLARQMQGDLKVLAPAGGGCCFVATLPVSRKRDDQVLAALEADLATGGSPSVAPKPRHHFWTRQRNGLQR
jgi:signal transduction histidine kinase